MIQQNYFSRLEISLPNCLDNFSYFKSKLRPSTKVLILVKANAYGHGSEEFSRVMALAGADWLGVAFPSEGAELRRAGIKLPILVLTSGMRHFDEIVDYSLEPGIPNLGSLKLLVDLLRERNITDYPIHINLDTGMHRLGFMTHEIAPLLDYLLTCPQVRVSSLYSHLAASDDPEQDEFTHSQAKMFKENADRISAGLGYKPMYHILNSAGIERFPQYQFDMVRLGIGIYGISALPGVHLAPAASLKGKILQIKTLKPSDGTVGYGRQGSIAPKGSRIATISLGYADGIDRHLGCGRASFNVNGHRAPTIGRICMDMCMLDISGIDAKEGDTVTIFGEDPRPEELAEILDTIPYELMTGVNVRVRREVEG